MRQTWRLLQVLWDTGNFFIRLAIALIVGWPIVFSFGVFGGIRGDAAVLLALMPAAALVLLLLVIPPMLPALVIAIPSQPLPRVPILGRIQLPSRAERMRVLKRALKLTTLLAGIETGIGTYLAMVPVWQDPSLFLRLLVIAVIFVLLWLGGFRNRWLTIGFATVFLVITAMFFFGGKEEAGVEAASHTAGQESLAPWTPQKFEFAEAGEYETAWSGPGIFYEITPNKPWIGLSVQPDGSVKEYKMPAGKFCWNGGGNFGHLRVKVEAGTVLLYQRKKEV